MDRFVWFTPGSGLFDKFCHVQVAAIREALSEEADDEGKKEEAREEGA